MPTMQDMEVVHRAHRLKAQALTKDQVSAVLMSATPSVLRTIAEFREYLFEMPKATDARKLEIRQQAVHCEDLMNYSYECADVGHHAWNTLSELLDVVFQQTYHLVRQ